MLETGVITGSDPLHPNKAVSGVYQREIETETKSAFGGTNTHIRYVTQHGVYDQAKQIEPKLRNVNDKTLAAHLVDMGCHNEERVLRRRAWTFPPLLKCRKDWETRFPDWKWRNPTITEWRPEETSFETQEDVDTTIARMNAAS